MRLTIINILFCILLIGCQSTPSLKIATSSNMQFAMEEIVKAFEKENNIKVELIISSSGKLTSQIELGAPFDVFAAANIKYPQYLYEAGLTNHTPEIYAYGQLVLWTLNDFNPRLEGLTDKHINKIAIANPKTAPYGQASIDVLNKRQIYKAVEVKLIYGESISQCNQFITTQSADIGFTAMSVVLSPSMKTKGHWINISTNDYTPIAQSVVILKKSKQQKEAQLFYDFLMSETAQKILLKYGYLTK
jgi:molybdate transport system substrate-binding protein